MADFLNESFGAETSPVTLDELIPTTLAPADPLPAGAMRNRAATLSLLTDNPAQAGDNYQLMMAEAEQGDNTTLKGIQDNIVSTSQNNDIKGVMSVLSDPNMSMEQKHRVLNGIKSSQFLKDTTNTLFSKALANPSPGDNVEHEDARLSIADRIGNIYQSRQDVQALINAHGATLQNENNLQTFGEMNELYMMPFGNNINTGKVAGGIPGADNSIWGTIKRYAAAGTTTADIRKQLESIPPEKRVEFTKSVLKSISQNSGIIFSNDNQFAQFDKATTLFDPEGYSTFQEWMDNLSPILDVVGLGQIVRGGGKAAKVVAKAAPVVGQAAEAETVAAASIKGASVVQPGDLAKVTGKPTGGAYDTRIASLEAQKAELLGSAGNRLDKGTVARLEAQKAAIPKPPKVTEVAKQIQEEQGVTSKEAKRLAQKQVDDATLEYNSRTGAINNQLTTNAKASDAEQKIADLDKHIAALQKNNTEVMLKKTPLQDAMDRIELNSVIRAENPAAPAHVVGMANPSQGRAAFQSLMESTGDTVAQGLYGTNKTSAIVAEIVPQIATESGRVTAKVFDVQRIARHEKHVPDELLNALHNTGANNYTLKEKAAARARVVNDFSAAEGLTVNDAMSSFSLEGGRIKIGAVYGTADGPFINAQQAADQAKRALRGYGIREDEIEILARDGLDFTPVDLKTVNGVDGEYLVRVNTSHEIDPTDVVGKMDVLDVKRNFLDRIPASVGDTKGSASRHILDAASMLHSQITGAAVVASDQSARVDRILLEMAKKFSDKLADLPKARQTAIQDYIREANYNGIKFDPNGLQARGFSSAEINTLADWKNFWDGHYYLENYDLVRTMNAQGYQLFENSNTKLYAKPIPKNQNITQVYDASLDAVVSISKAEGDALYASGGTIARLRRPGNFNGATADHMIVRNTPTEYTRRFRDTDEVLNYRDGYFTISYKAPRFVEEIVRDGAGKEMYRKAIAVAGDTKEAQAFAERMATSQGRPITDFNVRGDVRAIRHEDDAYFDLQSANGRVAQRVRGKLLEDGAGLNHLGDGSYIVNPVDSAVRAASSIAGRTVSRPMLESAKARAISQYGHMFPSNGMGGRKWPQSVGQITLAGKETSKEVADARTTYEYINYLENGYINSMDEFFKQGLNAMADRLAGISVIGERAALLASETSVTGLAKRGVFTAYIGSNFLRQLIVQPHQIVRTFSYNPQGWISGSLGKLMAEAAGEVTGLTKGTEFSTFMRNSGMLDAVDKSNLVRGTLKDAADNSNIITKTALKPFEIMRRIGFDMGESANLVGHAAAVWDKYKRAGANLKDLAVQEKMHSEIRAMSYDMNFAGDMVYNQTSAAALLQFLQVPHKAFLQTTTRRLDRATRARMVIADTVLWGGPTAAVSAVMGGDILPDNPTLREGFVQGLESMMLNNLFRVLFDDEDQRTDIDLSALQPYDMQGWLKIYEAGMSEGFGKAIEVSPAGQLFLKDGGRVRNAMSAMARFFGIVEDIDETPETFIGVMDEVLKISSIYSNGVKAKIMLDAQKSRNQYGAVIDKETTSVEAWAQALGFPTADTRSFYEASMKMSKDIKKHKEEVDVVYNDIKRYYYTKLQSDNTDPQFITKVTGRVLKVFENDIVAQQQIASNLARDLQSGDSALLKLFLTRSMIPNAGTLKDEVKQFPISQAEKDKMFKMIDDVANIRHTNEEKRK